MLPISSSRSLVAVLLLALAALVAPDRAKAQFSNGDIFSTDITAAVTRIQGGTLATSVFVPAPPPPAVRVGLTFSPDGQLLLVNDAFAGIHRYDSTGTLQGTLTGFGGPGGANNPVFDAAGNMFVAMFSTNVILKFPPGSTTPQVLAAVPLPESIAVTAGGDLLVTGSQLPGILRVTQAGAISLFDSLPETATTIDIRRTTGDVYVGGVASGRIWRYAGGIPANRTVLTTVGAGPRFAALRLDASGAVLYYSGTFTGGAGGVGLLAIDPDTGSANELIAGFPSLSLAVFGSGILVPNCWNEVGDAGNLPASAQVPTGTGSLDRICGKMDFGNDVDMYKICLTGGGTFSASVSRADGFDAQLFLFDAEGKGVYSSDDTVPGSGPAVLPSGHPLTPVAPGVYYLAVNKWNVEPFSPAGAIFPDGTVLNGPTGPGGALPVSGWTAGEFQAGPPDYEIALTGATFCPANDPLALVVPADLSQGCDAPSQTATVNFVVEVTGSVPAGATLVVTDTTGNRVLLSVAAAAGSFGVGPNQFPGGVSEIDVRVVSGTSGVLAQESFSITIEDNVPPVLLGCADRTIECQGELSQINEFLLGISATDDCDPAPKITFAPAKLPVGTTSVLVTATDRSGNATTCPIHVTVRDSLPPVFTVCPDDIAGECTGPHGRTVSFTVEAVDLCGVPTIVCKDQNDRVVLPSGSDFAVGVHTVTCTATDTADNSSQCTFQVTIVDTTDPVLTTPDDITVGNDPGECFAKVSFVVTATDLCDPNIKPVCEAPWGVVQSGDEFPVGTTLVVCTARDHSGNKATSSFNITVEDREAPAIATPAGGAATVVTDCKGSALAITAADIGTSATDNCDGVVAVTCDPAVLSPGTTAVTCRSVDAAGNQASALVQVTVLKGPFDCRIQRPLDFNVDNLIKAGQTVPIKVEVTCENMVQTDVTATVDTIEQLSGSGTPIANEVFEDSGLSNDNGTAMRLAGDLYVFNLSTRTFAYASGKRHRVTLRIARAGHVDTLCELILVNR